MSASALEETGKSAWPGFGAKARILRAEVLMAQGKHNEATRALDEGRVLLDDAAERIADPALRRDFVAQPVFRRLVEKALTAPAGDRRIAVLYDLIRAINSETDHEALLETILDTAIREVRAERGMILLRDDSEDVFTLCAARNLEAETEKDAEAYSRGIVAQAGEGRSVLTLDAGHDERFRDLKSVSLYGIRSLMCVPLRSRGRIIGTVDSDTRREGALFNSDDLRFLEVFVIMQR